MIVAFSLFGRRQSQEERKAAEDGRLPPGQRLTEGWPVLQYGSIPTIDLATWKFQIVGLVQQEHSLTWSELVALPQTTIHCDIHCVTHWSKFDNDFAGVLVSDVLAHARPKPEARFAMVHSYGGYTTNLPIEELAGNDCLLALSHNGSPLTAEHGAPLRLVIPRLYLWKSAKWVRGFELVDKERPGFWETYGYHMHGDPWQEERYS